MTDDVQSRAPERYARAALTSLLLVYGIALLRSPGFAIIDNVNLPIHETGHIVFGPFGEFIGALGGYVVSVQPGGAIVPASSWIALDRP